MNSVRPLGNRMVNPPRSRRWWIVSIIAHIAFFALLAQIVFTYPLGQLLGIPPKPQVRQEKLHYITLPKPTEHSGRPQSARPAQGSSPAALPSPTVVPKELPPVPMDSGRARAAGGTGTGLDPAGSGMATGVVPRQPDSRITMEPGPITRAPLNTEQTVDSVIGLVIGIASDSLALAAEAAEPPEWLVKTKLGTVGVTRDYIQLGKLKIPTALLALTALNRPGPVDPIEARRLAWIRNDIMMNAQRSISEDEFRAAVKRIRERKERERREREEKPIP